MINRLHQWESALADYLRACEGTPFAWGVCDCSLFAADAVRAMTGVDHGVEFRGKYKTAAGAVRVLKRTGGVSGIADAALGARVAPLMLARGDLAAVHTEKGEEALGVVGLDGRSIAVMFEDGFGFVAISMALHGWRV